MVLNAGAEQLELLDWPEPVAGPGQLLLEVLACGVCRTDLHILDGDLAEPAYPLVPGHQIPPTGGDLEIQHIQQFRRRSKHLAGRTA